MNVTPSTTPPSWWSQATSSGEADVKEDVRAPANQNLAVAESDDGWGGDGFGFDDFIDVVNPLQHLPFVSTLYRELTGDQISPAARTSGGALYGGPAGLIASVANVMFEAETGSDIGGTAIAALTGRNDAVDGDMPAGTEEAPARILAQAEAAPAAPTLPSQQSAAAALAMQQQTTAQPASLTPDAVAAYAKASVLTNPSSGSQNVDWASGVVTPKSDSTPGMQTVSGGGLDALIRESRAKVASRKRGPSLPSLTSPGLKTRGATAQSSAQTTATDSTNRAGLADWMMNALDKYETMKVETGSTS